MTFEKLVKFANSVPQSFISERIFFGSRRHSLCHTFDELLNFVNTFPKSCLLIIAPPFHHAHAINRIMCSHPEYYWDVSMCNMPYESDEHCVSSLVWPERVDHFNNSRTSASFIDSTRKQDLLITYREVSGGQYLDENVILSNSEYMKQRVEDYPNKMHTVVNNAIPSLLEGQAAVMLDNPKLVITPCDEGFKEMNLYNSGFFDDETIRLVQSTDYQSIAADYYLDYRNLFTHDYNTFYTEYMNLVEYFKLTPNEDAVRGFILRLMDRMKHCDEYLWPLMLDDGTLKEPYYSAPYRYEDLYSPVFREFEAAYQHFIRLKDLPYQMNAVRTRILLDLDKKNR